MMHGNAILKVEKAENGYEVEVCDSKIMESNEKPKSEYKDPYKSYVFKTAEEVKNFIGEHLDSLKPPPDADTEYASAFDEASKEK